MCYVALQQEYMFQFYGENVHTMLQHSQNTCFSSLEQKCPRYVAGQSEYMCLFSGTKMSMLCCSIVRLQVSVLQDILLYLFSDLKAETGYILLFYVTKQKMHHNTFCINCKTIHLAITRIQDYLVFNQFSNVHFKNFFSQ